MLYSNVLDKCVDWMDFWPFFFEAGQVGEGVLNSCPPHFRCVTNSIMSSASRRVCLNVWKRSKWWKWPTPSKPSQKTQAEAEKREPGQAWVRHVSSQKQQLFSLDLPTFRFSSPGLTFFVNSLLFHQESRRRSRREGEKKKEDAILLFRISRAFYPLPEFNQVKFMKKKPSPVASGFLPKIKETTHFSFFFFLKKKDFFYFALHLLFSLSIFLEKRVNRCIWLLFVYVTLWLR